MTGFTDLIKAEIQVKLSSADNLLDQAMKSSDPADMEAKENLASGALHYLEGMLKTLKLLKISHPDVIQDSDISDLERNISQRKMMVF